MILKRYFSTLKKIGLVAYPSGGGQLKKGVEKTPKKIIKHLTHRKNINYQFCFQVFNQYKIPQRVGKQSLDIISNDCYNLYKNVKESIYECDKTIILGGDHSMALGTIPAVMKSNKNSYVIWIDAHADMNTPNSSMTSNAHGMPLSFVSNINYNVNLHWILHTLPTSRLIYIGLRDLDPYESSILKSSNIMSFSKDNLIDDLPYALMSIYKKINNNPVHISFDVDVMDPLYIPCTGTRVENGFSMNQMNYLLNKLKYLNIKSIDFVELNLKLGNKNDKLISWKNSLSLLEKFINI